MTVDSQQLSRIYACQRPPALASFVTVSDADRTLDGPSSIRPPGVPSTGRRRAHGARNGSESSALSSGATFSRRFSARGLSIRAARKPCFLSRCGGAGFSVYCDDRLTVRRIGVLPIIGEISLTLQEVTTTDNARVDRSAQLRGDEMTQCGKKFLRRSRAQNPASNLRLFEAPPSQMTDSSVRNSLRNYQKTRTLTAGAYITL